MTAGDPLLGRTADAAQSQSIELPAAVRRAGPALWTRRSAAVFFYVTRIRDRRFVAIDRERGIAFAFAFFDNGSGDARNGTLSDGRKVSSGPSIPWT